MEGDVRREELVLEKIRMEISSRQTRLKDIGGEETPIKKAVLQSCAQLEAHIQQGALPFKQNARLKVLRSSKNKLKPILLSPRKAASQVWGIIQDEIRLTRENTLDQQIIEVDGSTFQAKVIHDGMVALYFELPNG